MPLPHSHSPLALPPLPLPSSRARARHGHPWSSGRRFRFRLLLPPRAEPALPLSSHCLPPSLACAHRGYFRQGAAAVGMATTAPAPSRGWATMGRPGLSRSPERVRAGQGLAAALSLAADATLPTENHEPTTSSVPVCVGDFVLKFD